MERVRKAPNSTQHPNFDITVGMTEETSVLASIDRIVLGPSPLLAPTRPSPPPQ